MDDIEFVESDGKEPSEDELLDVGAQPTLTRRLAVLALVAVAAAGIAVAIISQDDSKPQAAPTSPARSGPSSTPAPGQDLVTSAPMVIEALIPAPGRLSFYAISDGRVVALDLNGTPRAASRAVHTAPVEGSARTLAFDPVTSLVWAIPIGNDVVGTLEGYDAANLRQVVRLSLPDVVDHAAVLDGQLYLMTRSGRLLRTQRDGRGLETVTRISGSVGAVAADPQRHRLLLLLFDRQMLMRTWSPSGDPSVSAHLPFAKGDVTVVDGAIWAGGFASRRAVLVKVDPRTLHAGHPVAVSTQLGPGALLAGGGEGILFVRSGSIDEPLWCLDATTGAVEERWSGLPGTVALTGGAGLIAPPLGDVRVLNMTSCGR
ncbi:MAG: hypothetical protein QOJ37_2165 [Pseudonocardiales bacterium]|nr:hypothetical protein [Pseudonocardiales bacterium]